MPLYSTVTPANADGSDGITEPDTHSGSGKGEMRSSANVSSWCYLFVHRSRADRVREMLSVHFPTFIHTSIYYRREGKHVRKDERPTISGLVFVQGDSRQISNFLHDNFFGLYLVKDCSSGRTATISDHIMQGFMRVASVSPTRIRFLPHSLDYYSSGNALVRITSGSLAGMEGYRLRISRDKCLVTTLGDLTVAIGGIHRDSFENLDEYVRQRRAALREGLGSGSGASLSALQREIDAGFFTPSSYLDVLAIVDSLSPWLSSARDSLHHKDFDRGAEISLFILEEIGSRFRRMFKGGPSDSLSEIISVCRDAASLLTTILHSGDASDDLKTVVETGLESLCLRFPYLPLEE